MLRGNWKSMERRTTERYLTNKIYHRWKGSSFNFTMYKSLWGLWKVHTWDKNLMNRWIVCENLSQTSASKKKKESSFLSHSGFQAFRFREKFLHAFVVSLRAPQFSSVQFSSVVRSCPTLCDPLDCSTPGFPVHHQVLELTQTHVHRVRDAIQSSHPLLSASLPAFNTSQHQGLFKWVNTSHQVAKCWSFSFSISSSNDYSQLISLGWTSWIFLQFKGLSRVFSNTKVQRINSSAISFLNSWANTSIHNYWENHSFELWLDRPLLAK